ncbi:RDD family protein [Kiloniella laminariae]|uniref:RDD family protein n=1 Tax=Kiloniella laminariae TaxID=454162 RepID=A0ABT4LFK5_9PROT|nr:RDD family protein [Kiloniella laminariae]MCZ4279874.1 RDD family protein [Kiloniella laminariae]
MADPTSPPPHKSLGWIYWTDNQEQGPVSRQQLAVLLKNRQISSKTFVRREESDQWSFLQDLDLGPLPDDPDDFGTNGVITHAPSAVSPAAPAFPDRASFPDTSPDRTSASSAHPSPSAFSPDRDPAQGTTAAAPALKQRLSGAIKSWRRVEGWNDGAPHPWRRFFARQLDNSLYLGLLLWLAKSPLLQLAQLLLTTLESGLEPGTLLVLLIAGGLIILLSYPFIHLLLACANALVVGLSGCSVGKWFFGIRVLNREGKPLGLRSALQRELSLWRHGLCFGLPIADMIFMVHACFDLGNDGITTWDRKTSSVIAQREDLTLQMILGLLGLAFIYGSYR